MSLTTFLVASIGAGADAFVLISLVLWLRQKTLVGESRPRITLPLAFAIVIGAGTSLFLLAVLAAGVLD